MDRASAAPSVTAPAHRVKKKPEHPLGALYSAERANDLARHAMFRALADWTTGKISVDDVEVEMKRWAASNAAFVKAVKGHPHVLMPALVDNRLNNMRRVADALTRIASGSTVAFRGIPARRSRLQRPNGSVGQLIA